jgi:cell division protein FtsB
MKWFATAALALVLVLNYRIWLSPDVTSEVLRLKQAVARPTAENDAWRCATNGLPVTTQAGLQALEEQARSELGMIADSETYQVVPAAAHAVPQ